MKLDEAIEKLKAYLKCQKKQVEGIYEDCNNEKCDNCNLCYEKGNISEHIKSVETVISEIEKQSNNQWISCKERLPEELEDVLVYFEYFRYGNYNCMYSTHGIGYQYEGRWHIDGYGKVNVFAWMPLPKPYKESDEK